MDLFILVSVIGVYETHYVYETQAVQFKLAGILCLDSTRVKECNGSEQIVIFAKDILRKFTSEFEFLYFNNVRQLLYSHVL